MPTNNPKTTPHTREDLERLGYQTRGNCFEVHANQLLSHAAPGTRLVHALVRHSAYPHIRYAHAWLEVDEEHGDMRICQAHDRSNGKNINTPSALYRHFGQVVDAPGELAVYTKEQAVRMLLKHKHYGPWELNPSL